VDTIAPRTEQRAGDADGIGNAHSQSAVQLPDESEPEECGIRDSSGNTAACGYDVRNDVLGEKIVRPFDRSVDHK
jgi:hypothetical protein